MFTGFLKWNICIIYLSYTVWSPHYQTVRLKARALTGSTFGVYGRFKSEVHTNKESVDNLNFFNDTVFITVMFGSILQPNMTFYLSKR